MSTTRRPRRLAAGARCAPRGPGRRAARARASSRLTLPVLLLLPALIIIVGLVGYPLGRTIWLSFTDTRLGDLIDGGERRGSGSTTTRRSFTDGHLRTSLVNTVVFGMACVIGTMALRLRRRAAAQPAPRGQRAVRRSPCCCRGRCPRWPPAAIWRWLFDDQYGFVNWALSTSASPLPGLRLVRRPRLGLHRHLRRRRLAVVPVRRAQPAGRAADAAAGDARTRRASTARPPGSASGSSRCRCCARSSPCWWSSRPSGTSRSSTRSTSWPRACPTAPPTPRPSPPSARRFALGHFGTGAAIAVVLFARPAGCSRSLYIRLIGGRRRRHEVAAPPRLACTCAMIAVSAFALFPVYWVRDHVAQAARARSTRARRTSGRATRSGASTRACSAGPRRPRAA